MSLVGGSLFDSWLLSVKYADGCRLDPEALGREFGLSAVALADLCRVHRNTVRLNPESTKLQGALTDVVKVLSAAHGLCGDMGKSKFWFLHHPIADLRHQTAMELVKAGKTDAVLAYIESISSGATG